MFLEDLQEQKDGFGGNLAFEIADFIDEKCQQVLFLLGFREEKIVNVLQNFVFDMDEGIFGEIFEGLKELKV